MTKDECRDSGILRMIEHPDRNDDFGAFRLKRFEWKEINGFRDRLKPSDICMAMVPDKGNSTDRTTQKLQPIDAVLERAAGEKLVSLQASRTPRLG